MTDMHKKGEKKNTFALYNYNLQLMGEGKRDKERGSWSEKQEEERRNN